MKIHTKFFKNPLPGLLLPVSSFDFLRNCICIFLFGSIAFPFCQPKLQAQNAELDSLHQIITTAKDTTRLIALMEYAELYRRINTDSAITLYTKATKEAEQFSDLKWQVQANSGLAITYGRLGDNANAMPLFKKNIELNKRRKNQKGLATVYSNIGIAYKNMGDYSRSLNYYLQSLQIRDSIGDLKGKGSSYTNLGVLYHLMGDVEKSKKYYKKYQEVLVALGKDPRIVSQHLGLLEEKEGNHKKAISYLQEYRAIIEKEGDPLQLATLFGNLGYMYRKTGQFEIALDYIEQSIAINEEFDNKKGQISAIYNIVKINLDQKEIQGTKALIDRHLQLSQSVNNLKDLIDNQELYKAYYELIGDYKNAFLASETQGALLDSLDQKEKNNSLQQWQARLDFHEKTQQLKAQNLQIELLEARGQSERRWLWALALSLLSVAVIAFSFFQSSKLKEQTNQKLAAKNQKIEIQNTEIETMNQELEKRMLRAQINPHFIFNSLSSIQHFITSNDKKSALVYLSKFSLLLRQSLEHSMNVNVVLAEEIKLLKTYLELEALRFDHQFSYDIEVDETIPLYEVEIPILLVQPYVENSILHGILPREGSGKLEIKFIAQEDFLVCTIKDNGIGRAAAAQLKTKKMDKKPSRGIAVTEKRIHSLYKDKNNSNAITYVDLTGANGKALGTEVIIRIPK